MRQLFLLALAPCLLLAQGPPIGIIDFYGRRQVSVEALRKALGVKEGDPLPRSKGDAEEALERVDKVTAARLEAVCCEDNKAILYVGIEERGAPRFPYREPPAGTQRLPEPIHDAYVHFLASVGLAVRAGQTGEDLTRGHSLMEHKESRAWQERFIPLAAEHLDLLRDVLRNSFDEEHRAIAAYVIGYAPDKQQVVNDLQYALRDPDDTVRNNAMRSLGAMAVLASRHPDSGIRISPTWFVELLHSLVWSDRTTAAVILDTLSAKRDEAVLDLMRTRGLQPLVEMARWKHLPHALPAFILVGRMAGLSEEEIQQAWARGEREKVIALALKKGRK